MAKRHLYGIFNDTEWPQVQTFADMEGVNVSELVRRAVQIYAEKKGFVIRMDERIDYHERSRRA